jgi:diguanylate cyclase (GGDEF)-like protein
VGQVSRSDIMGLYTSRFGRDLYGRRPVRFFMDPDPRIVTETTPVESLSRRITAGSQAAMGDDFIITDPQGDYRGMGTLVDLLQKITELQIRHARYANPLTQLPGNVPINEHMDRLIAEQAPFVVAYFDLDNFKPFNDLYGYALGDEVIRRVAELLTQAAVDGTDFVGHVGGDDFIVVWRSPDWEERTRTVLDRLEAEAPTFYSEGDRARGGMEAADRSGEHRFFPFLSLSVGAIPAPAGRFASHSEISSVASEVKHAAKEMAGNALFIDRRHGTASLQYLPSDPEASA